MAGVPFAQEVFDQCRLKVTWNFKEGDYLDPNKIGKNGKIPVAKVEGPVKNVLIAERTALNLLARASGIATQ